MQTKALADSAGAFLWKKYRVMSGVGHAGKYHGLNRYLISFNNALNRSPWA